MSRLTTKDNPFNPITDFDNWRRFDEDKGYNSCTYLARIAFQFENILDENEANETAIDEIIKYNGDLYKKVTM